MLRAKQLPMVNTVCPGLRRKDGLTLGQSSPPSSSATSRQRERLEALCRRASAKLSTRPPSLVRFRACVGFSPTSLVSGGVTPSAIPPPRTLS